MQTLKTSFKLSLLSFVGISCVSVLAFYLSLQSLPAWALGQTLLCGLMWSWFSILHTCGHNSYFKQRKLNHLIGHLASLIVFIPYFPWKYQHQAHHLWTGNNDKDPTHFYLKNKPHPLKLRFFEACWRLGLPVCSFVHGSNNFWSTESLKLSTHNESQLNLYRMSCILLIVAHVALVFLLQWTYLQIFLLPWLFFLFSSDIILLSQHALLPNLKSYKQRQKPLPVTLQNPHSRTIYIHPLIDRWVLLNFNLHNAHHRQPNLPHYALHKYEFEPAHKVQLHEWISYIRQFTLQEIFWPQENLTPLQQRESYEI